MLTTADYQKLANAPITGILKFFLVVPMVLTLVSCTTILDTHSTGPGPVAAGALPGDPPGDSVTSVGNVLFNGGNISLNATGTSPAPRVNLSPGGKPHNTSEYSLNFSGVKLTTSDTPVLAIDAIDDAMQIACGLEIAGGDIRLIGGAGAVVADTYTGNADEHRILLRMDKNTDRCFVRVEQVPQGTDGPPIKPAISANAPFINSDFDELDLVRVRWEETSSGDATQYFLGQAEITKRD